MIPEDFQLRSKDSRRFSKIVLKARQMVETFSEDF